ncbi:alpha/beta hydrolase [Roseibium litorale]|uniref:Alpha/beta fold hydrolase n=1 Tax=Roseibium litorale TaxID=2803841 RepID=A0ABR9CS04_9HYPH|nr:alpha/beta hydrolase [Roseibium litorale]MBD8893648.1 alpha/beta fold hydrolase [Roseibium litorale]
MDHVKRNEAMRRAMSRARMLDYGLSPDRADEGLARSAANRPWEGIFAQIANDARKQGLLGQAAQAMNFAQMADSFDTPERIVLFKQGTADFAGHVAGLDAPPKRIELPYKGKTVYAWDFGSGDKAILVLGGMSGWAASFLRIAAAVTGKGMRCILMDGPGQGDTRIIGGLYLHDGYTGAVSAMVDHLEASGSSRIGVWGNSMGGLFAMISARDDRRLRAACSNGAPPRMFLPEFRMAAEQMAALFGVMSVEDAAILPELEPTFEALAFNPALQPLPCPGLICEGGKDPLAPPGVQKPFLDGAPQGSDALLWEDGEHAIYNHGDDRNEKVTRWFAARLAE